MAATFPRKPYTQSARVKRLKSPVGPKLFLIASVGCVSLPIAVVALGFLEAFVLTKTKINFRDKPALANRSQTESPADVKKTKTLGIFLSTRSSCFASLLGEKQTFTFETFVCFAQQL